MELLSNARERFPIGNSCAKLWMQTEQLIAFERALLRADLDECERCVDNLSSLSVTESRIW